ncbi:MAG TPA: CHASE domain-containing protein [Gemmatimonadaceae bacterium]|nr:CHASE domain-containing protein [Gemmatimonadaceae bacterium]
MTLTPIERGQRPGAPAARAPGAHHRRPVVRLRTRIPLLVLTASLLLTAGAGFFAARLETARHEAAFATAVQSTRDRIEHRLELKASILQGAGALFASSGEVTREEFRSYVRHFAASENYPGVQGVGFARRVTPANVGALERGMHAQGVPGFHVWPMSERPNLYPIVYLEPLDARNRAALGFDMFTEPVRAAAMAAARDSGMPMLSGRVRLVQEIDHDVQPGFLIYEPVYEHGTSPSTVEARQTALVGWVYSPFRARDLFTGIFGSETEPRVAFQVYDGATVAPEYLLFDSRRPPRALDASALRDTVTLPVFGRTWTLAFAARPSAADRTGRLIAPAIVIFGVLVSLVLFAVTRAEVQARARAQHSEITRSRFYAAMSHELRTPLNAILGYNDLLLVGVYGPLAEGQQRGIERSQLAARHLLDVVNDVLDLSKIEAGKMDLDDEPVAIAPLVQDLFTTLHRMAEEAGATLRLECDDPAQRVHTDARRVRQILLNLLSNAIKFGSGGQVLVRCTHTRSGGVEVTVVDEGPGIAEEDQQQIFEEFVQLPSLARGGTGLGLPISRKLATILGGSLTVESAPGAGATFRLTLPAVRPRTES